ncbi:MAG: hypothetical protein M1825_003048 [Sarcosagium campestre]|nr:MAG: hypothetical protein M1825_003048 [Sarcosagium campestre]
MSLIVAAQSVVYYVLACTSCRQSAYQRRRKREAAQARLEKELIEADQPHLYRHPSPFSTNVYWHEEMTLGPGPPQKKKDKERKGRVSTGGGTASSMEGSACGSLGDGTRTLEMQLTVDQRLEGDHWNRRRYQREDEALWGHELFHHIRRGSNSVAGSSTGPAGINRIPTASSEPYYAVRNPPLNELHPPVVSAPPTDKTALRWMLQPPPNARVMSGKERANRIRSDTGDTGTSSSESGTGTGIGTMRQVLDPPRTPSRRKISEEREVDYHLNARRSSSTSKGRACSRDTGERISENELNETPSQRRKRSTAIPISEDAFGMRRETWHARPHNELALSSESRRSPSAILQELQPPMNSALNMRSASPLPDTKLAFPLAIYHPGGDFQFSGRYGDSDDELWLPGRGPTNRREMDLCARWSMDI